MAETQTAPTTAPKADDYRSKVSQAYDGEIFGAEFFGALATRFASNEARRKQLEIMRDVELVTAEKLRPLVSRLGIPAPDEGALKTAARNAAGQVTDWDLFVAHFKRLVPGYVATFEALAAVAPPQDRAIAQFLIDHEVAFADFTEKESTGQPHSVEALESILRLA